MERTFNQWMEMLKFKDHRVVKEDDTYGIGKEVYILENRKRERIQVSCHTYLAILELKFLEKEKN